MNHRILKLSLKEMYNIQLRGESIFWGWDFSKWLQDSSGRRRPQGNIFKIFTQNVGRGDFPRSELLLRERARCTKSCSMIGYPSGQDSALLPFGITCSCTWETAKKKSRKTRNDSSICVWFVIAFCLSFFFVTRVSFRFLSRQNVKEIINFAYICSV